MARICLRATVRSGVRHAGGAPRVVHESTAFPNVKFDRMDAASRGMTCRSRREMHRRARGMQIVARGAATRAGMRESPHLTRPSPLLIDATSAASLAGSCPSQSSTDVRAAC